MYSAYSYLCEASQWRQYECAVWSVADSKVRENTSFSHEKLSCDVLLLSQLTFHPMSISEASLGSRESTLGEGDFLKESF